MRIYLAKKKRSKLKSKIILSVLWLSKKIKGIYSEERDSCSSDTCSVRGRQGAQRKVHLPLRKVYRQARGNTTSETTAGHVCALCSRTAV